MFREASWSRRQGWEARAAHSNEYTLLCFNPLEMGTSDHDRQFRGVSTAEARRILIAVATRCVYSSFTLWAQSRRSANLYLPSTYSIYGLLCGLFCRLSRCIGAVMILWAHHVLSTKRMILLYVSTPTMQSSRTL